MHVGNRFVIEPLGERIMMVRIAGRERSATMSAVHALQAHPLEGVIEIVPASGSVAVHYDPRIIWQASRHRVPRNGDAEAPCEIVGRWMRAALENAEHLHAAPAGRSVVIPVCYDREFAPDLPELAELAGMPAEEAVRRHASGEYAVEMIGFLPGFPYLDGLPEDLHASRLARPRGRVAAGSVGIGGDRTGIYPQDAPGGWRIIGRTPVRLFTPEADPPALLQPGDRVRFEPIGRDEFDRLQRGSVG